VRICIDPGHGGSDPGAVGNGLKEKDITLAISLEVDRLLKARGLSVIMTRYSDIYVGLNLSRAPISDLSVSIHVNAGGGQGLETWISIFNKTTESKKLGQAIQDNILKQVDFRSRGLKSKVNSAGNDDYLYMIRKPAGVAVLVECGFIDSAVDAAILSQSANLKRVAAGIVNGILQYLGMDTKGAEVDVLAKLKLDTQVDLPDVKVTLEGTAKEKAVILNVDGKDTTYIPAIILRDIGMTVDWDGTTRTVKIAK